VAFMGPHKDGGSMTREYPKLVDPKGRKIEHVVILKLVTTNICGSYLQIYNGRVSHPRSPSRQNRESETGGQKSKEIDDGPSACFP
jgi:threonine dehydrogenase-like Zn-dependent dehydrogenase